MNRQLIKFFQFILGGLDFFTLNILIILSAIFLKKQVANLFIKEYLQYWASLNIAWVLVFLVGNTYSEMNIAEFEIFSRRTMRSYIYWVGLLTLYLFFTRALVLSRIFIFVTISSFGLMLIANRFIYLALKHFYRNSSFQVNKVLIIGYNRIAKKLESYLETKGMNTQIVGYCEEEYKVSELTHYPILCELQDAMVTSREYEVNEIFSTIPPEQTPGIYNLMRQADQECIRFKLIADFSYFVDRPVHVDYYNDIPVLSLRNEPLNEIMNKVKKRFFDIFISSFAIVFILSWLIPLVALLIWLDSGESVFFVQLRNGKNNKVFPCYKFRSMYKNAEEHSRQATKNDERLTRLGKILRRTNLDEFPQFLNVFVGDMSIVGPRPHMIKHTEEYSKILNQYMVRHFLKPGITGWAQVNGLRGETRELSQMAKRVEHDLWYMENWSMLLDVRILFLTLLTTFKDSKYEF
jgi:putative colanic acid biosynthesis UDP-glucose lipid carrier transferase